MKSICVFCGSSAGNSAEYQQAAIQLADYFIQNNIRLVYGGGNLGLMGTLATRIHENGGQVLGIIPHALYRVCGNQSIGETRLVKTMHDRKLAMHHESDAFIALPGGFGTMEELIETTTWSQLRIHHKPVGVLNVNGFYGGLLTWMEEAAKQGFIDTASSNILVVKRTADELMHALCQYKDPFKDSRNGSLSKEIWEETIL
jgi:uncharacterized protein (TIGR00730 family)